MILTRFAPSPTGLLHIGHAFAALTAFDTARAEQEQFLLRIEDIDQLRCKPAYEEAIYEDLAWLGLNWPRPVRRQSEHFADYERALEKLNDAGLLYPCFCTRKDLAAEIAEAGAAPHGPEGPLYPGTCRTLSREIREQRIGSGEAYALRLDMKAALTRIAPPLMFEEKGSGPNGESGMQRAAPEGFGDVVLARKDMPTSYHLAVVVDDALQGVTLVTRGNDLFAATSVQRLLQALLDLPAPIYAHHRLILDAQGKKFSKRDGAVTLKSLRESGVTPMEIRARLGLL
jgi:glutamyl-Q tRNA(Asp) synthetase